MITRAPFFFIFLGSVLGSLFFSAFQFKILGLAIACGAILYIFFIRTKGQLVLALFLFAMGLVWLESPYNFPSTDFFLIAKVRSVSSHVIKSSSVRFYKDKKWWKGRDSYIFLNTYQNKTRPQIQNTFMALVKKDGKSLRAKDAFWVSFDTPIEKLYDTGSKISLFLYTEMKKYVFSEADTVASIFLGRKDVSYEVRQTYKNGGYAHIFAVSGMHVGFISFLTLLIISEFLPWNFFKYPLTFFFLTFYGFMTGFSIPTLRAISFFGLYALFKLLDRPQDFLNVLGLVGTIEVILDPSIIFDVSFQLSYSAVTSIAILFPILPRFRPRLLSDSFNLTVAANVGVVPFLILNYGKIYLASFIFNISIVPILTAIILEGAFFFSLFSLVGFHLAEKIIGGGIYPFAKLLDIVAYVTEKMPLSVISVGPKVALFWITLSSAVLPFSLILFLRLKPGNEGKYRKNSTDDRLF